MPLLEGNISIDTVYQTVLALANKEQSGTVTPQEFNLFANRAQMEIFEQYFYDINQWNRAHGNETQFSDPLEMLEEKIKYFTVHNHSLTVNNRWGDCLLPESLYRLGTVRNHEWNFCEPIRRGEEQFIYNRNPLTRSHEKRPIYTQHHKANIKVQPYDAGATEDYPSAAPEGSNVYIDFIKKPEKVHWGYIIVDGKALYDPDTSISFGMHSSEEVELVDKILAMTGVKLNKPDLSQAAIQHDMLQVKQEKS